MLSQYPRARTRVTSSSDELGLGAVDDVPGALIAAGKLGSFSISVAIASTGEYRPASGKPHPARP